MYYVIAEVNTLYDIIVVKTRASCLRLFSHSVPQTILSTLSVVRTYSK